jgi:ketosteroid isomerase-like protein
MNRRNFLLIVVVALTGAAMASPRAFSEADARSAILKTDEEFARAAAERGVEGFASFVAEDFQTIRANSEIINKKEFVESWAPLLTNPARRISWRPFVAVVSEAGDLGYTIGAYEIRKVDDRAKPLVGSGKYVSIWRKQRDGKWKLILDTGVQDDAKK